MALSSYTSPYVPLIIQICTHQPRAFREMQEQHRKKQNHSFLLEQGQKYPTQPFRIQANMQINSKSSKVKVSYSRTQQLTPQNRKKPTNSLRTQNRPKNLGHPKNILNQLISSRNRAPFGNKFLTISKAGTFSQPRDESSLKDYCQRYLTKIANKIIGRRKRKNKFEIKRLIQEVSTYKVEDSTFQSNARELIRRMLLFDYSPNQNQKVECQQQSKNRALLLSEFKKTIKSLKGLSLSCESLQKVEQSEKGYSSDFSSIFQENSSFSRSLLRQAIEEEIQAVPSVEASAEPLVIEDQQEIKALLMSEGLLTFEKSGSNIQQIGLLEELEDDQLHNESYQRFCKQISDLDDEEELQGMSLLGNILGSPQQKDQEVSQFT